MNDYLDGKLLVAPPSMRDLRFAKSVIYIWKHDVLGAAGVVLNRPLEEPTWRHVCQEGRIPCATDINPTMYWGGPVMSQVLGCLHTLDYLIPSTNADSVHLGFTMDRRIINDIAKKKAPHDYIVTMGVATWASGQLEEELLAPEPRSKHESWLPLDYDPNIIWQGENAEMWNACVNMAVSQHSREFTSKLLRD